jgi:hypothetical protein
MSTSKLILSGRRLPVERAELCLRRSTSWPRPKRLDDAGVKLGLDVRVDEHSGEDGAPAPVIQSIPVRQALGRWPYLDELSGLAITLDDDAAWDAWVGNDASALCANRLEFGRWSGRSIKVSWSATVDDGDVYGLFPVRPRKLKFEGPVSFARIELYLYEDESIEKLVTRMWGADAPTRFNITRVPREPWQKKRGRPDVVGYDLWPRFLGPRAG